VNEVLISFSRPASLGESEMRAWIAERARDRGTALMLAKPDDSSLRVLRVRMHAASHEALQEEVTDLMLDMRLLGLRPSVLAEDG
jgi:hypothetical protein